MGATREKEIAIAIAIAIGVELSVTPLGSIGSLTDRNSAEELTVIGIVDEVSCFEDGDGDESKARFGKETGVSARGFWTAFPRETVFFSSMQSLSFGTHTHSLSTHSVTRVFFSILFFQLARA